MIVQILRKLEDIIIANNKERKEAIRSFLNNHPTITRSCENSIEWIVAWDKGYISPRQKQMHEDIKYIKSCQRY